MMKNISRMQNGYRTLLIRGPFLKKKQKHVNVLPRKEQKLRTPNLKNRNKKWHGNRLFGIKLTSIAQAGIATALAITEALPNIPLSIVIGALGAIQVATILATPIPSYAEGTKGNDRHPGGKALVGDAGKHEVVMYSWKSMDYS